MSQDAQGISWLVDFEERSDGWYSRFNSEFHQSDKWIGPYPSQADAALAVNEAIGQVMADITKVMLGLK